jgi:hypothetical protein
MRNNKLASCYIPMYPAESCKNFQNFP